MVLKIIIHTELGILGHYPSRVIHNKFCTVCVEDPNPQYWADGLLWPWTGDSPEYMSHKWRKWVSLENFVSAVQMAKGSRKYF